MYSFQKCLCFSFVIPLFIVHLYDRLFVKINNFYKNNIFGYLVLVRRNDVREDII